MGPADEADVALAALDALPQAIAEWRAALKRVKANPQDRDAAAGHADDALKAARKVGLIMESAHDATTTARGVLPETPPADRWAKAWPRREQGVG